MSHKRNLPNPTVFAVLTPAGSCCNVGELQLQPYVCKK